jgi:hypothetical protein
LQILIFEFELPVYCGLDQSFGGLSSRFVEKEKEKEKENMSTYGPQVCAGNMTSRAPQLARSRSP